MVSEAAMERNRARTEPDGPWEECARCGFPVAIERALWIYVCNGGWTMRQPHTPKGEESADLGLHALGVTCAKRYPGYALTEEEWAADSGEFGT